ncbi:sugar ABC transporter ATP-binding protein [Acidisoma sp. C75]
MRRVELRGIAKNFGGVHALKGVDATIEVGRVLVLLGENGAGKSTLIKVMTGAVRPDGGEILIDGTRIALRDPEHANSLGIAAVYQEPMIYPHLSVLENIFVGREMTDAFGLVQKARMAEAVRPWLAELDLPESILGRGMGSLGLGHMQLVLIAQALVQDARVIILDEPTSILSRAETDRLVEIIKRLKANGRAIVYITHRLEEVPRIGDQVTVLTDGRVTGNYPAREVSGERLLQLMAGKSSEAQAAEVEAARHAAVDGKPLLSLRGLSHPHFFSNVDWDIPAGAITGVYGLVGAGRSEVAMSVFGALAPAGGTITLDGQPIAPRSPAEAMRLGIGYLPEDRKRQGIFSPRSLESNLTSNALGRFQRRGLLDFAALQVEALRMIRHFGIKVPGPETAIGALSGGNQQKGLFARWAGRPLKLLILDEPTRGIDLRTKEEIHDFIRGLARAGLAVVVISSDLAEILALAQRMIVMRQGRVVDRMQGTEIAAERVLAAALGTGGAHSAGQDAGHAA